MIECDSLGMISSDEQRLTYEMSPYYARNLNTTEMLFQGWVKPEIFSFDFTTLSKCRECRKCRKVEKGTLCFFLYSSEFEWSPFH